MKGGRGAGDLPITYEGPWQIDVPYQPRQIVKLVSTAYLSTARNIGVSPDSDLTIWLPLGGGDSEHNGTGTNSTAVGTAATATVDKATSLGDNADATGTESLALGYNAGASAADATAIGVEAVASASSSVALGGYTVCSGIGGSALGWGSYAQYDYATAVGSNAWAGHSGIAVGNNAHSGDYNVAIGVGAGPVSTDPAWTGGSAVAVGYAARTRGSESIAIGYQADARFSNSIAIGKNVWTTAADIAIMGTNSLELKPQSGTGSTVILNDTVTGARQRVSVASGVITVTAA